MLHKGIEWDDIVYQPAEGDRAATANHKTIPEIEELIKERKERHKKDIAELHLMIDRLKHLEASGAFEISVDY
jgi:hypothetical protein